MIEILFAGMATSIQDSGRYGYQSKGVSVAGAMDQWAYKVANVLVANPLNAPCLEMVYLGPTLRFHKKMEIALTGAAFQPLLNGRPIPLYETVYVQVGDVLQVGSAVAGTYGYLALSHPLDLPPVLGSWSTDIKSGVGGFEGRLLKNGDGISTQDLVTDAGLLAMRKAPKNLRSPVGEEMTTIRFLRGQEYDRFIASENLEVCVSETCSRMGYRLNGGWPLKEGMGDILSDGLSLGTIQGTASGEWIVMMADRQPTGGYARFGHVISADLAKLVQARPGRKLRFKEVTIDEAHEALQELKSALDEWSAHLKPRLMQRIRSKSDWSVTVNQQTYRIHVEEIQNET